MKTRLVAITPEAEKIIVFCARVSSDQENTTTGLLKYMIRHGHWSPFEMAHATVEIVTSRAVAQQIIRHRSFAFQEFSQRYQEPVGYERYQGRRQADKNRQSSVDDLDISDREWFSFAQSKAEAVLGDLYGEAKKRGIARESARFLLPGFTRTRLYMAGSMRSWIHYVELRTGEDVQLEHREIASSVRDLLIPHLPTVAQALGWTEETK